jgi:hypothetical protein
MQDSSSPQEGPFTFNDVNFDVNFEVRWRKFEIRKALLKSSLLRKYTRDIELIDSIASEEDAELIMDLGLLQEEEEKLKTSFKKILKSVFIRFLKEQNDIVNVLKMEQVNNELLMLKLAIGYMEERTKEKQEEKEKQCRIIFEVAEEKGKVVPVIVIVLRIITVILFTVILFILVEVNL